MESWNTYGIYQNNFLHFVRLHTFPLLICTWFLKNQFGKIKLDELDFLSISNILLPAFKIKIRNRQKNQVHPTWFFKLDFLRIKYRSIGGMIPMQHWKNKPHLVHYIATLEVFVILQAYKYLLDTFNMQSFIFLFMLLHNEAILPTFEFIHFYNFTGYLLHWKFQDWIKDIAWNCRGM